MKECISLSPPSFYSIGEVTGCSHQLLVSLDIQKTHHPGVYSLKHANLPSSSTSLIIKSSFAVDSKSKGAKAAKGNASEKLRPMIAILLVWLLFNTFCLIVPACALAALPMLHEDDQRKFLVRNGNNFLCFWQVLSALLKLLLLALCNARVLET
ncbi:hypothetical protein TSUD_97470 [Trifolium subterraneum]|uniref:Uncharacterized protein n=1 Tax=Trifolium subterraneum TaxID=3900 RepID=A0A2Z6LH64_TRISU|nr:hypothetical protein TSUD_97470 [Trifolium subterraneum]